MMTNPATVAIQPGRLIEPVPLKEATRAEAIAMPTPWSRPCRHDEANAVRQPAGARRQDAPSATVDLPSRS
jgi:hypothetical protein